jgi:hypothetical protein
MDAIVDTDEEADPQLAYLTGLFHDVGEILLRQYFPEEFVRIGELSMATGRGHREVEALILGIPHHELVATMLSILKLPEAITGPIREFLQLDGRDTPVKLSRMARCLTLANQYAHGLQLASTPSATVAPVTKVDCRRALGNADVAPLDNVRTRCDVLSTTFLLARMTPSEEASLSRPWFPQRQTQIWYARHSALAEFDPLCAALDLLGHVTVHDHPPRDAEEFGDKDCVVMAVPRIGLDPFSLIRVEAFLRSVGRARPPILCHVQRDVDRTKQDGSMMKIVSGGMPLHELAGFVTAAFLEGAPDRAPAACASGET